MLGHIENGIVWFPPPVGLADGFIQVVAGRVEAQGSGHIKQMPIACKRVDAGTISGMKRTEVLNEVRSKPHVISGEVLSEVPF